MTQISAGGIILPTSLEEDRGAYLNFSGKRVMVAWDNDLYIQDLYEMWLEAVQQEKAEKATGKPYTPAGIFEDWLKDCLKTLRVRKVELSQQMNADDLDANTYQNAKMTAELGEEAIIKYLEKTPTQRLIGI